MLERAGILFECVPRGGFVEIADQSAKLRRERSEASTLGEDPRTDLPPLGSHVTVRECMRVGLMVFRHGHSLPEGPVINLSVGCHATAMLIHRNAYTTCRATFFAIIVGSRIAESGAVHRHPCRSR